MSRYLRPLTGLIIFTLTIVPAMAATPDLAWLNPENLPPPLRHPLRLLATTGMSGEGQDYFSLKPGSTATIGTVTGPAIIFRVWSTSSGMPNTSLEMTVDGKKETLYARGALPAGAMKGDPLRTMDGQAYWSYLPVFVKQQAVFRAQSFVKGGSEPMRFYLQVGYRNVTPEELAQAGKLDRQALKANFFQRLSHPIVDLNGATTVEGELKAGTPWQVPVTGPAMVYGLHLDPRLEAGRHQGESTADYSTPPTAEALRATRLVITCDGVRTVDAPLGVLFGVGHRTDVTSVESVAIGTPVHGTALLLRFPMPLAQSMAVALEPFGAGGIQTAAVTVYHGPLKAAPKYRLCAQYFSQLSVQDQPMTLLNVTGEGIFVGTNMSVNGLERKTFAFLEGNEQIYIDGDPKPTIEGTGTEDYFNNAWYFASGEKTHLFSGVTFKQDREPLSGAPAPQVDCYRYLISDCMPFKRSFRFDLQHGSRNKAPNVLYEGVMLWYQASPTNVAEPVAAKVPVGGKPEAPAEGGRGPVPMAIGFAVALVIVGLLAWRFLRRKTY